MNHRRRRTMYADSHGVHIAYQVTGPGNPVDLVFAPGSCSHLDLDWEWPGKGVWLEKVSGFARLIRFDKRGTGLSDRVTDAATLEERTDDIRAVMDAVESAEAVISGYSEGGNMAMLFAATYPERTRALILSGTQARWWRSDDFPHPVWSWDDYQRVVADLEREGVNDEWLFGPGAGLDQYDPMREFAYRYAQAAVSPSAAAALERMNIEVDTRALAPLIQAPTLVVNASNDPVSPIGGARWLAEAIPGATLIEFDASTHTSLTDDAEVLARIEEFVTGVRPAPPTDRVLATVLFTDIVGSTEMATRLGDQRWAYVLEQHDRRTRDQLARFRGHEVKTTGDGFVATFDGPERAVRCATQIAYAVEPLGIRVRAGLHTGEVVQSAADIRGVAVHLAARVMALAPPGRVLVSRTVRDLVVGSTLRFADAGTHRMRGIEGEWQLYDVA